MSTQPTYGTHWPPGTLTAAARPRQRIPAGRGRPGRLYHRRIIRRQKPTLLAADSSGRTP